MLCSVLQCVAFIFCQWSGRFTSPYNTHTLAPLVVKYYNAPQRTAIHCTTLHHTAPHCNTLQHTVTHSNTLLFITANRLRTPMLCGLQCVLHICWGTLHVCIVLLVHWIGRCCNVCCSVRCNVWCNVCCSVGCSVSCNVCCSVSSSWDALQRVLRCVLQCALQRVVQCVLRYVLQLALQCVLQCV